MSKNKLSNDIAWTMGSVSVLALSGIVINVIVTSLRDASALGVFNLSYAVYIVASQMAVLGVHYSVLRFSAFYDSDPKERGALLLTALVVAASLGFFASVGLYFLSPVLANSFSSDSAGLAIRNAAFGLLLFPINKVLISYLNGLRHMRAFSVFQACRYLLVMGWVAFVSASPLDFELSTFGFLIAELATSLAAGMYILVTGASGTLRVEQKWVKIHLSFGGKSLLSGMFVEMNSRIDILLLGVLMPEKAVGVYSFAAMLADGLYHLLAMVRVNFNPVLVAAVRDRHWLGAKNLLASMKRYGVFLVALASICIFLGYLLLTLVIVPERQLIEGWPALAVLLLTLTALSAFVPFDNLMIVSGHPGYQALQHLAVVDANVMLCAALVPAYGITGAAISTAASYVVGIVVMIILAKRLLGWNLIFNETRG